MAADPGANQKSKNLFNISALRWTRALALVWRAEECDFFLSGGTLCAPPDRKRLAWGS
jgi:hypothetical protein